VGTILTKFLSLKYMIKMVSLLIMSIMSNRLAKLIFNPFHRQISVNIISTQNNINNFQAYLFAGPLTFTFTKGKIYIKTLLTLMGQPTTTATLSISSIEANSDFIKVTYSSTKFLNSFKYSRVISFWTKIFKSISEIANLVMSLIHKPKCTLPKYAPSFR